MASNNIKPILMAQPLQAAQGRIEETYVFRLLGSVYKKSAGEETSAPTVVELEVQAPDKESAQAQVTKLFAKIADILKGIDQRKFFEELQKEQIRQQQQAYKRQYGGQGKNWKQNNPNKLPWNEMAKQKVGHLVITDNTTDNTKKNK